MSFGPASDVQRDAHLLEDVARDLGAAWLLFRSTPMTPADIDTIESARSTLRRVIGSLAARSAEIDALLHAIARERTR